MKRVNLVCLFTVLFTLGFYSCSNDELNSENNNLDEKKKYISVEERMELLAEMIDTTVITIETVDDLNELRKTISDLREQELLNNGYTKIEEENIIRTKASVQRYSIKIHPYNCVPIQNSKFVAKFNKAFCDKLNVNGSNKLSPDKNYICGWRDAGTFFNLAANQSGGPMESPQAALKPTTKSGYTERGYDAYVNAYNQYILTSHQLEIICEDVKNPTIMMEIRYPFWDTNTGYVLNYAILTR